MAQESLVVSISEKGALVVKRNIESIGKSAKNAEGGVSVLRSALGAIGVGLLIANLTRLADQFTNIQNRIRTVTTSQEQLNQVTEELFAISNRTRSSFEGTAEIYARVALAAKDLGISQQQVLHFTESLNQAILLGGSSASEAQAGMIQLSQGLASGALRGDELRSVLEQLPVVSDVIAKSLGVTRGELRIMGQEGKITANVVLKAFEEARGELSDRFGKAVPTVGQAIQVLKNDVLELVGGVSNASGASSGLAEVLLGIAKFIPKLKEPLMVLADVVVTTFSGFSDLFRTAGDSLQSIGSEWTSVFEWIGNALLALLRTATQVVDKLVGTLLGAVGFITAATQAVLSGDFKNAGDLAGAAFAEAFNQNALTGILDGVVEVVQERAALRGAEAAMPKAKVDLTAASPSAALGKADGFEAYLAQLREEVRLLGLSTKEQEIQAEIAKARKAAGGEFQSGQEDLVREAVGQKQAAGFDQYLAGLERENVLLGMNTEAKAKQQFIDAALQQAGGEFAEGQRERVELLWQQRSATEALNEEDARKQQLMQSILGPEQMYKQNLADLNELLALGKLSQDQYNTALKDLQSTLPQVVSETQQLTDGALNSLWGNATSALDNFVDTGVLKFSDFARSVINDIQKIILKMILLKAMQAAGIPVPSGGFATGGSFMVGGEGGTDNNLVAFRASRGERVDVLTPAQQSAQTQGQTSASSAPVSVTIINVVDPNQIPEIMASEAGQNATLNTISLNGSTVRQAIS